MKLLGVQEAAKMLDVHPNTLRRWQKKGLIRAVKLPTGIRRFCPEDVNRLQREMFAAFAREALAELAEEEQEKGGD